MGTADEPAAEPADEPTREERDELEGMVHGGYQPVGGDAGAHTEPPAPPPGRASASRGPDTSPSAGASHAAERNEAE